MMFSRTDSRWMLLAHLSKHQAARDKMLEVHWDKQNHFKHIGKGSLFELGFDYRLIDAKDPLFSFKDADERELMSELENELSSILRDGMPQDTYPVSEFLGGIGNRTAARNSMIFDVIGKVAKSGDILITGADGKKKSKSSAVKVTDILVNPPQKKFSFDLPLR